MNDPAQFTRSDWRPTIDAAGLALRSRMRGRVRAFFALSDALEVDTPVLVGAVPAEPHIEPMRARALGGTRFLRTSPESAMKRLLAAGVGDCWQLGPVFRDHESGRWHQPEFTMLEWYRTGIDHHELMQEVEALLVAVMQGECSVPPAVHLRYRDVFRRHVGLDPVEAGDAELHGKVEACGGTDLQGDLSRADCLDWLLATTVLPALPADVPVFIHAWPADQASLARLDPADPAVACRFELYWQGLELANGFHELIDADEQRKRFEADLVADQPMDEALLDALAAGMPDCAGVAVGFDRLVALAAGTQRLDEVIAFPSDRA